MPEIKNPVGGTAQEAGAIDHIRPAFQQGLNEVGVNGRIVLQIGILDHHVRPGGQGESGPQGSAFAEVSRVTTELDGHRGEGHRLQLFPSAVGGGVIHHDDFADQVLPADGLDDLIDRGGLIEHGHDHGKGAFHAGILAGRAFLAKGGLV